MYITLYRKYRPKFFREVVGQDLATKVITNSIIKNNFPHAFIFTGTRGTGKTTIARIFAKSLNCLNRDGFEPCNQCSNCLALNSGNFPDCIEIDAASNRGIDEIRHIRETVKYVPLKGKYKIYIIDEVHMLTTEAFNSLLKTLEEPPSFVVFILATTDIHKVPLTILSRCQRIDFKRIHHKVIFDFLKKICELESISIHNDALFFISKLSNGSVRDALSILEQVRNISEKITLDDVLQLSISSLEWVYRYIYAILTKNIIDAVTLLNLIKRNSVSIYQFLYFVIDEIKNIIYYSYTKNIDEYSSFQIENYQKILNITTLSELRKIINILIEQLDYYKNDNDYLFFEIATLNIIDFSELKNNIEPISGLDSLVTIQNEEIQIEKNEGEQIVEENINDVFDIKIDSKPILQEKQKIDENKELINELINEKAIEKNSIPKQKLLELFKSDKLLYKSIENCSDIYIEGKKIVFVFGIEKKGDITYSKILENKSKTIINVLKNNFDVNDIEIKKENYKKETKNQKISQFDRIVDYTERI